MTSFPLSYRLSNAQDGRLAYTSTFNLEQHSTCAERSQKVVPYTNKYRSVTVSLAMVPDLWFVRKRPSSPIVKYLPYTVTGKLLLKPITAMQNVPPRMKSSSKHRQKILVLQNVFEEPYWLCYHTLDEIRFSA